VSASGSGRSLEAGGFWIVDDSGFPKQGQHSVGVARQDCGVLGKIAVAGVRWYSRHVLRNGGP